MSRSKCALVTGASSGIGAAIAELLYRQGYEVHTLQPDAPSVEFRWIPMDLSGGRWRTLAGMLVSMPQLDVCVNSAGAMPLGVERSTWETGKLFHLNAISPLVIMQTIMDINPGPCSILNVCSTSGWRASAFSPVYGATKAALWSFTQSYAVIGASKGIRVNAISPGFTDTQLVPGETDPVLIEAHVPLGFEATPAHIAEVALAVIHAEFMTGSNVLVDGGELAGFNNH